MDFENNTQNPQANNGYQQPNNYQQPNYQQPNYQQPNYQQPNYQQPNYQQPNYQQPNNGYYPPQQPYYQQTNYYSSQSNGMAIAGLIFAFFFPLLGLIFSIIGLNKSKTVGGNGRGISIAGIIISALGILATIISVIIVIIVGGTTAVVLGSSMMQILFL